MAYDIPGEARSLANGTGSTQRENGVTRTGQSFFVSVRGETLDEVQRYWDQLSVDAAIVENLAASPWSSGFAMLTDVFGITWIFDVAPA
ncbi:hypothetical protein BH09ACT10_BH09ACT10_22890 [soil metagenome]